MTEVIKQYNSYYEKLMYAKPSEPVVSGQFDLISSRLGLRVATENDLLPKGKLIIDSLRIHNPYWTRVKRMK